LTSSTGVVDPNEEAIIEVKSKPTEAREYEETILVTVSEPSYGDRHGKLLKVHVIACEPKVNFDDISNIFREQYVVDKMDDYLLSSDVSSPATPSASQSHHRNSQIESPVIFAKSEMKLFFNKVPVNTTETTRIRIQNVGHVPAHVTGRFTNTSHVFSLSPDAFSIDPYQTENVMIIFTPDSLDVRIISRF
jgi:hypothetical protein